MREKISKYIHEHNLIDQSDRIILAVSGGIDSMTMANLLLSKQYNVVIAHCNFNLRGAESDADEKFVHEFAEKWEAQFYVMHFNTLEYAGLQGISVQMAARELRYNWFENLRKKLNFDLIAIATNADDSIETFFINLMRSTGIKGLTGIQPKTDRIIRPLLCASRNEIEKYAQDNNLEYRTDSSNQSDKYQRNFIRHKILPLFDEINPSFRHSMAKAMDHLKQVNTFVEQATRDFCINGLNDQGVTITISIPLLKNLPYHQPVLLELLKPYGFNPETVVQISDALDSVSGTEFFSNSHRILKDREHFIISPIKETISISYTIEAGQLMINEPLNLQLTYLSADSFEIPHEPSKAAIDADKLIFPLIIRKWKPGDYFMPLGMGNMKKLSDFFVDSKFSIHEKENQWLLTSGDDVVWIIGRRIDDRYKITAETERILLIEYKHPD